MREKEAKKWRKDAPDCWLDWDLRIFISDGYLQMIKKVGILEDALQYIKKYKRYSCDCSGECSCDLDAIQGSAEGALEKWKEIK